MKSVTICRQARAVFCFVALVVAGGANAQAWPAKPIRLISPFPPGGAVDLMSRAVAQKIESLGQPVIVENRPGANGIIGIEACAKADGDGHTLCLTNNDSVTFNAFLFRKLPYNPRTDLIPVAHAGFIEGIIVGHPGRVKSMKDAMDTAKARPNTLSLGSFGPGSIGHLYAEWLAKEVGVPFLHVPFKGAGPAMQAVIAGQVDMAVSGTGAILPLAKAGKLVPLVMLGERRSTYLPDTPTFRELGVNFSISPWLGIFAPKGVTAEVVQRVNAVVNRAAREDAQFLNRWYTEQAIEFWPNTPAQFAEFFQKDLELAGRLVKIAGVTLD